MLIKKVRRKQPSGRFQDDNLSRSGDAPAKSAGTVPDYSTSLFIL